MRHFLRYILATALVVLGLSACKLEDTYYVQGVQDMVTATTKDTFISDYGVRYTVTDDKTDRQWAPEKRYLIDFDITDRSYNITLNSYKESTIVTPVAATWEKRTPGAPILVRGHSIGGGYLSLIVAYYRLKNSSTPHRISMEYRESPNRSELNLYLVHESNGEVPESADDSAYELVDEVYSFKLANLLPSGEVRLLFLTIDQMDKDKDGNLISEEETFRLYDESITF